jgi:hypothetical protein
MRRDYTDMLARLCLLAGVPTAEQPQVMQQETMLLAELPVLFRLDEASGFVKLYVDVGAPPPALLPGLCQRLLESQFTMPAPFAMLTALDAQSGHLALVACLPLCRDEDDHQAGFEFLQACVQAALLLREGIESGCEGERAW